MPAAEHGSDAHAPCSSGSDSDEQLESAAAAVATATAAAPAGWQTRPGSMVPPLQVLRVVQAYAEHIPNTAPLVPRLLGSLHVLMCQAVLIIQQQGQHQQLEVRGSSSDVNSSPTNSSRRSSSSGSRARFSVLLRLPSLHDVMHRLAPLWEKMSSQLGPLVELQAMQHTQHTIGVTGQMSSSSDGSSSQGIAWQLLTCAYVALSVALAVQEPKGVVPDADCPETPTCSAQAEAGLVLAAAQMAIAALKVLLPALLLNSGQDSSNSRTKRASRLPQQVSDVSSSAMDGVSAASTRSNSNSSSKVLLEVPVASKLSPVLLHGVVECSLATLQALVLLVRHLQSSLSRANKACSTFGTAAEAAAAKAAQAAVGGVARALDGQLKELLSMVVSTWQSAAPSGPGSSSSSIQASLQHHIQQEIRCWATAAVAACYGQLGACSREGRLLAAAQEQHVALADAQLSLHDGQVALPVHAAVLAAGCPVLGRQLQNASSDGVQAALGEQSAVASGEEAAAAVPNRLNQQASSISHEPGKPQSSQTLLGVKLSAAVERGALQLALDYIYTGAAASSEAGLAAQLAAACSLGTELSAAHNPARRSTLRSHGLKSDSLHQRLELQLQLLDAGVFQQVQQRGQQQLAGLGRLAKKLQLPLLAALCRQVIPCPGQQLQLLHPQLTCLLPAQLLLLHAVHEKQQQGVPCTSSNSSSGSNMGCSTDAAGLVQLQRSGSAGSSEAAQHEVWLRAGDAGRQAQQAQCSTGSDEGRCESLHTSCLSYLDMLADFSDKAPHAVSVNVHQQQQQQRAWSAAHGNGGASAASSGTSANALSGLAYADVLLAAPALLQSCPQQQQVVVGLLPAHQVLLTGCEYFEALFSQRWRWPGCQEHPHWQRPGCRDPSGYQDPSACQGVAWGPAAGVVDQQSGKASLQAALHGQMPELQQEDQQRHQQEWQQEPQQQRQEAARLVQVVVVPEADVHVAAALQHWLYTGQLQVALPAQQAVLGKQHLLEGQQQQQQQQHIRLEGIGESSSSTLPAASGPYKQWQETLQLQLNGCTPACHACRTLLRLWRCADLLLLPALQERCLAAVEGAAARLLSCRCCLVLLQDCCELGVVPAADSIMASLISRYGEAVVLFQQLHGMAGSTAAVGVH